MTDDNSEPRRLERERSKVAQSTRAEYPRTATLDSTPALDHSSVSQSVVAPGKLSIEPIANPNNDPSLTFDWRIVDVDSHQSCGCTIGSHLGHSLTVEIEQGLYKRVLRGAGEVQIAAIPLAEPGVSGKLAARDDETGANAEFTWQWRAAPVAQPRLSLAARLKAAYSRPSDAADSGAAQALSGAARDTVGVADAGTGSAAIDGEWWCQPYIGPPFALRISGSTGVATLSNAPAVYAPGDTILYIDRRTPTGFSGRLLYTHGKFLRIEAMLTSPDEIRFTAPPGQGGDYERSGTWTRRAS